jgi:hypothetical protein
MLVGSGLFPLEFAHTEWRRNGLSICYEQYEIHSPFTATEKRQKPLTCGGRTLSKSIDGRLRGDISLFGAAEPSIHLNLYQGRYPVGVGTTPAVVA